MANETTAPTASIQESEELDDCRENIPPEVRNTRLKVQGDALGYASAQPWGGNEPVPATCTFSTPASASNRKKSPIAGFQSALTPILKYLNIGSRCPSLDPSKLGSKPHVGVPITSANCQTTTSGFSQRATLGLTSRSFGQSLREKDAPQLWLDEECLPEMTLLDVTCDSTMQMTRNDAALPDSAPATPVKPGSASSTLSTNQPCELRSSTDMVTPPESNVTYCEAERKAMGHSLVCKQNHAFDSKPSGQKGAVHFSEASSGVGHKNTKVCIALSRVNDNESDLHLYEVKSKCNEVDSGQCSMSTSEPAGMTADESIKVDLRNEELSSTLTASVCHTTSSFSEQSLCEREKMKSPLEVTRDISMVSLSGSNASSSELSGQLVGKSKIAEDTLEIHAANVTRDINSTGDMSVQCTEPQLSTSNTQCDTSLKNSTVELHVSPSGTLNCVEANEDQCVSRVDESMCETPQTSPKTSGSMDGTFTVTPPSKPSTPTSSNATDQIPAPQNQTLDFPPSDRSSPKSESEAKLQVGPDLKDTAGSSLDLTGSAAKTGFGDVPNVTFDRPSIHKSSGTINMGEAVAATFCLQNNTFDSKPSKQDGTITLSDTSSRKSPQITVDKAYPLKACNPTTVHKEETPEVHPMEVSEHNGSTASGTEPDAKVVSTRESTFEAHPAATVEDAPVAGECQASDHLQSVTDGLSDSLGHHGMDTEGNKANTFNLDDTLDLKADSLVTSTPMPQCKVFHISTGHDVGKAIGTQKKLYGDGPGKPACQPTDVLSNIVSDRKTFLTQPAAKSFLPPLKATSHLLRYKSSSTLAERCEQGTAGIPVPRRGTQAEAVRNAADSEAAPGTSGISIPYNLRPSTIGYKQANSGLPRPHLSGIPSGIQRAAPGLRIPLARSCASTDKLHGPTATNPVAKVSQPKKHILTRAEPLPTAKRKKMDAPLPAASADASFEAVNGPKNLKQPATVQRALPPKTQRNDAAPPASATETSKASSAACRARVLKLPANVHRAHGCARCVVLEEQLKIKSEEIRRLKEELLKHSKQEDEY